MLDRHIRSALLGAAMIGAGLVLSAPAVAIAGDGDEQVATAAKHAELAAGADSIGMVHAHLHHAVNCLVGPDGAGFDAEQANPCANLGNGAIPDSENERRTATLKAALERALAGIAADDLAAARASASAVVGILSPGGES